MGLFSSKKTTNSTGTTDTTTMPIVPDWLQQPTRDLVNQNMRLGGANPLSYVAGTNSLLGRAQQGASDLTGTPWNYDAAGDLARGVSNTGWADAFINGDGGRGAKGSTYLKDYMNPYEDQVVRATSDDLGQFEGATRARQALAMAGNGAFGGSGAALTQGQTEGELARARASTIGGLRSRGFETAVSAGQGDAGRYLQDQAQRFGFGITAGNQRLNAADSIRANANDFGANSRANIGAQQSVGDAMRGVEQQQAQAPLDLASWQVQNMPPWLQAMFGEHLTGTETMNSTSKSTGALSGIAGPLLAGAGALLTGGAALPFMGSSAGMGAIVSDRRLKRDIVKLGERQDGIGVYLFRYLWSEIQHVGVMAQEVLKVKPEAVVTMPNGFYAVDYWRL